MRLSRKINKNMGKTLIDKVWDAHVVSQKADFPDVLYIDKQFIHEVTSPQAFSGLRSRGIPVFRTENTVATEDHNVPTLHQDLPIKEALSRKQVETLRGNCEEFGVELYPLGHEYQGIVHVIGPELGITKPGMTIVCGDSHTSTHGAFGAIAFGIGTSQVEQVLASQSILQYKPKRMKIEVNGKLGNGVLSKDIILHIISKISSSGATGYFVEYDGDTIHNLSMEARMTICNMSIEMGARGGMIAPDDITFEYMKDRRFMPKGKDWDEALTYWKTLYSDEDAEFDKVLNFKAEEIEPMVTYGTNPGMGMGVTQSIPSLTDISERERPSFKKALDYMALQDGSKLLNMPLDYIFIGSCTNARIEDLRKVASFVKGKKKADNVEVWVVPGSTQVAKQAHEEGIDEVLREAGFSFRGAGCSACLGMNEDKIPRGKYCISTSNRNFEGRQGQGARTILASPLTAAVSAITGKISDVREYL